MIYHVIEFLQEHFVYWLIPIVLFFNTKYLSHPDRRHHIAMRGWGEAARAEKPVFFCFLWFLHVFVSLIFGSLFAGYLFFGSMWK